MKLITLFLFTALLSATVSAEDTAWPLIPELAEQLQKSNAEDIHIGGFYFYYLSEDYQRAYNHLTELRSNNQVKATTLDILETTLLLALGIEDQALSVFNRIETDTADVPAKAWLYLARRWQILGNWSLAEQAAIQAFESKASPLNLTDTQEALYILVHSSVELEDTHSANSYFYLMENRGKWADLARHNLLLGAIMAYTSSSEIKRQVEEAAYYVGDSEESLAVLDRVYLLAGVFMLEEGHFKQAENFLRFVRQDSPYAAPALLEFGWARLEQTRFQEALQPWRVLQTKYENWHPAVIESVLAVPYAMEKMNATTQALYGYELVEDRLTAMLTELEKQQQDSNINQWLTELLQQQQGEWGWRRHDNLIDQTNPMARSLMSMLASSAVRAEISDLYDLQRMQQDLSRQLTQLDFWQETASSRQQHLRSGNGAERLQALEQRHQRLMTLVADLESQWQTEQKSPLAFANELQTVQIERLKKSVPLIKSIREQASETVNAASYMERWRRARGVLVWEMNQQRPESMRTANNAMTALRQQTAKLNSQLNLSRLALQTSNLGWQGYASRVDQEKQKIKELQQTTRLLAQRQQQLIVANVQADLQQQHKKLTHYLSQARLSLARLYDEHLQKNIATIDAGGEQ